MVTIEELERLGLNGAAAKLKADMERKHKMMIAYEHYRFVRADQFRAFNERLRIQGNYLKVEMLKEYQGVPPVEVLGKLAEAQERKCFDAFDVMSVAKMDDPLLFGRIDGCNDRFFIAQWDTDIKIEDLLKANEG
jgi:hypothetical protein